MGGPRSRDGCLPALALTLALVLCLPAASWASWASDGNLLVTPARVPSLPAVIPGPGSAYVEWLDGGSGYNFDLRLGRWTDRGDLAPGWTLSSNTNMLTNLGYRKYDPCATADGLGNALFAWSDDRVPSYRQVYAGRSAPDGIGAAHWTTNGVRLAPTTTGQYTPAIAADAAGGAFVAWQDLRGADADIYLQHVDSTGALSPGWTAAGLAVTAVAGVQSAPAVAADGAGGVFVAWRDRRAGNDDVYLQRVGGSGDVAPGWPANGIAVCAAAGNQSGIVAVGDGAGGVLLAWLDQRSGGWDVYAARVQGDGTLASGWVAGGTTVCVAAGDQTSLRAVPDGVGGVVIAWQDHRAADWDIYGVRLLPGGTRAAGWPEDGIAVAAAAGDQTAPDLAPDATGGAYIVWQDRPNTSFDVRAQHLAADGTPVSGWPAGGAMVCSASGDQTSPRIGASEAGACVAWLDDRAGSGAPALYAQWLLPGGPIPVRPSGLSAVYHDGQTFLTWVPPPDTGWTHRVYYRDSPFLSDADLNGAEFLGSVGDSAATDRRLSKVMGALYTFRVDSTAAFQPASGGLFVVTVPRTRSGYYAVTSQLGSGPEDRHVVQGGNALLNRIPEFLGRPRPVYQRSISVGSAHGDVYTLWTTSQATALYPAMCNRPSWPYDCAVVRGAPGGPAFVRFHQHGGDFTKQMGVTNANGEWVLAPDDYTLNKDVTTYWYGYHPGYDFLANGNLPPLFGEVEDYTNRRVLYTIDWWRRTFPLDPARHYAYGISLGGYYAMHLALAHPDLITAAMAVVGKVDFSFETDPDTLSAFNSGMYFRHQLEHLWGTTATNLPTSEGLPIYTIVNHDSLAMRTAASAAAFVANLSGRHDVIIGWAEKLGYFAAMQESRHGFVEFWDNRDHANQVYPGGMEPMSQPSYLLRFRSDLSWPAFSHGGADGDPGDGTSASGDTLGTINGYMDWLPAVTDSADRWDVTLRTRPIYTLWGSWPAPESVTVDVTPRRTQRFLLSPGQPVEWTATRLADGAIVQTGTVVADPLRFVTIPGVRTYGTGTLLHLHTEPLLTAPPPAGSPPEFRLDRLENPARGQLAISATSPHAAVARIELYDPLGRLTRTLWQGVAGPGHWHTSANLAGLAPGVYLMRAQQAGSTVVRHVVVLR